MRYHMHDTTTDRDTHTRTLGGGLLLPMACASLAATTATARGAVHLCRQYVKLYDSNFYSHCRFFAAQQHEEEEEGREGGLILSTEEKLTHEMTNSTHVSKRERVIIRHTESRTIGGREM